MKTDYENKASTPTATKKKATTKKAAPKKPRYQEMNLGGLERFATHHTRRRMIQKARDWDLPPGRPMWLKNRYVWEIL